MIFLSHLVYAENCSLIMEENSKMIDSILLQNNWEWREKSTHHHTDLNQMVEGFHNFLKACLSKHISRNREWDDVTLLATASYNWLPNQHSRESPFFVMFGRDALTNLQHLIKPKLSTWAPLN